MNELPEKRNEKIDRFFGFLKEKCEAKRKCEVQSDNENVTEVSPILNYLESVETRTDCPNDSVSFDRRSSSASETLSALHLEEPSFEKHSARSSSPSSQDSLASLEKCKPKKAKVVKRFSKNLKSKYFPRNENYTSNQTPDVMKQIEDRAKERAKLRETIILKKKAAEEEQMRRVKEMEEQKKREEKEERLSEIRRLKEEKEKEQQEKLRREREMELMRKKYCVAKEHYNRKLLSRYGVNPWKQLVIQARRNHELAVMNHQRLLMRNCFNVWYSYVNDINREKKQLADSYNEYRLKRMLLEILFENVVVNKETLMEAQRWYEEKLIGRVFAAWRDVSAAAQGERILLKHKAIEHHNRKLLQKSLYAWAQYPAIAEMERERQRTMRCLWNRVKEIIPDYTPPPESP